MKNLSIEQQKEFEKMKAKINGLHQENYDLIKSYNKQLQQLHNINKKLTKDFHHMKNIMICLQKKNMQIITKH